MAGFKLPDGLPVSGGDMKVELDKRALFALASDTRLELLKALESNRRTVSQLAELLRIDKAAVHRHLKKLEEGGFVARTEDHGFVYYALTWKSRDILNPNDKTKIVILISSSLLCVLAIVAAVVMSSSFGMNGASMASPDAYQDPQKQSASGNVTNLPLAASSLWDGPAVPLLLLGTVSAVLLVSAYLVWRTPRQRGGEEKETNLEVTEPLPGED